MNSQKQTPKKVIHEFKLLTMLAETPVHAGSGAELGSVDLPIQRERHTNFPTIHGSGVKGVLRDIAEVLWEKEDKQKVIFYFGSEPSGSGESGEKKIEASTLVVSDARLLLFPVRTVGQAFAWITCPFVLKRFYRDLSMVMEIEQDKAKCFLELLPSNGEVLVSNKNGFPKGKNALNVVLEEFEFSGKEDIRVSKLSDFIKDMFPQDESLEFWRNMVPENTVVLPDEEFKYFVSYGTEVVTRIRLKEDKIIEERNLWTEEYLPVDSFMYSVIGLESRRLAKRLGNSEIDKWKDLTELFRKINVVQFGGKETIGRGFFRIRLFP